MCLESVRSPIPTEVEALIELRHKARKQSGSFRHARPSSTPYRDQTAMEELMNALSHGVGCIIAHDDKAQVSSLNDGLVSVIPNSVIASADTLRSR